MTKFPNLFASLCFAWLLCQNHAHAGGVCIYNEAPYGMGTPYRLDSIVGPKGPGQANYFEANTFDTNGNPVSNYYRSDGSGMHGFPTIADSRLEFKEGVLTAFLRWGSLYIRTRKYLNASFLVDSVSESNDSAGIRAYVSTRYYRSGDTVRMEFKASNDSSSKVQWTKRIDYPAGDSIASFQLSDTGYSLSYICRPRQDTCSCTSPSDSTYLYEYVVANGLLKSIGQIRYVWRSLASVSVRRPVRGNAGERHVDNARYRTDGRRAAHETGRPGRWVKPAGVLFPMR